MPQSTLKAASTASVACAPGSTTLVYTTTEPMRWVRVSNDAGAGSGMIFFGSSDVGYFIHAGPSTAIFAPNLGKGVAIYGQGIGGTMQLYVDDGRTVSTV